MKNNHVGVYLQLHKENDQRELKKLQEVQNKQGYIKNLIRNDDSVYKKYWKGDKRS